MRLSAHAQNHKSCEYVPKSTTMIVNNVRNFAWSDWYFGDLAAFWWLLAMFSLRMRISVYLGGSGKKILTSAFYSLTRFLVNSKISAISRRFQSIFHRTRNTFCGTWYLPHSNCTTTKLSLLRTFTAHGLNSHISISGLKSDVTIVHPDLDFLQDAGI